MLGAIEGPEAEVLPDDEVERALATLGPREGRNRVGLQGRGREKDVVAFARLEGHEVFPGYSWRERRDGARERCEHGVLCQTAIEIQSAVGCPFDCAYCPYPSFVCVRLDVEAFVERVTALVRESPQALWKLNNRTDTLGLEPEYGLAGQLIERFSRLDDKILMLYTKGEAVDHLVGLEHRGRTVASFTLTPEPIAAVLEAGAPPPSARIEALGRLARAGYPTRVRFSPIVPVKGYREVYRELVGRLARVASPELVTLWTLSMIDVEELGRIVPLASLDETALAAARDAAGALHGEKGSPFPPSIRCSIYRDIIDVIRDRLPTTRVSLCLEAPEVWSELGPLVPRQDGGSFLCNCGPAATPEAVSLFQIRAAGRRATDRG
ncbi:MAG: hypothetical protein HYY06_16165 [Deltaproteobacteria bacterium]|nr:hypothetical protein [Deltaproteobacteria bacterium]